MSDFAANALSIDRTRKLFRVKDGDNNVIPRGNNWTDWHPLREVLPALSGGGAHLSTRNGRAAAIGQTAGRADAALKDLIGLSVYPLADSLRGGNRAALAERYRASIAHWHGEFGKHGTPDYVAEQLAELEHLLAIFG